MTCYFTDTANDGTEDETIGDEMPRVYRDGFSPVQVPKIDLGAFDESEDYLKLDDTLDEIEKMLNNNSTQDESLGDDDSSDNYLPLPETSLKSEMQIISGSSIQSPSCSNNMKKTPKTLIPRKLQSPKTYTKQKVKLSPAKLVENVNDPNFLIPSKPEHIRTPLKSSKPSTFKNIVSPVGLYIKYSPRVPLTTYVKPNNHQMTIPVKNKKPEKVSKGNWNNLDLAPAVIYQPSKKKLYTVDEHLNLPPSINKLVKAGTVVKHEKRILSEKHDNFETEHKLLNAGEITNCSINDNTLNASIMDVSVLASRQAFKK